MKQKDKKPTEVDLLLQQFELATTFFVLCEEGSFNEAGRKLGLTGTAIRNRITALEALLEGKELVNQSGRFQLTRFGQSVWGRCRSTYRSMLTTWNQGVQHSGRLVVGVTWYTRGVLLPRVLQQLSILHPTVEAEILDLDPPTEVKWLDRAHVILGSVVDQADRREMLPDLSSIVEGASPRAFIIYSHRFAASDCSLADLAKLPAIGSPWFEGIRLEHQAPLTTPSRLRVPHPLDAIPLVAQDLGWTVVPEPFERIQQGLVVRELPPEASSSMAGACKNLTALSWHGTSKFPDDTLLQDFVRVYKLVVNELSRANFAV